FRLPKSKQLPASCKLESALRGAIEIGNANNTSAASRALHPEKSTQLTQKVTSKARTRKMMRRPKKENGKTMMKKRRTRRMRFERKSRLKKSSEKKRKKKKEKK